MNLVKRVSINERIKCVEEKEELEAPATIEFDWGGTVEFVKGKDGNFYVDPIHIKKFKEEHGAT